MDRPICPPSVYTDLLGCDATGDHVTIVLGESPGVVTGAIRRVLEANPAFEVVAVAHDLDASVRKVLGYKPDVVVVDESVSERSLLDALPRFDNASPRTAVVLLTDQDELEAVRAVMRAGVRGVVLKQAKSTELTDAVLAVAHGGTYLDPELGGRVAVDIQPEGPTTRGLTDREVETMRLVAMGYTNPEVADRLGLSVRTVEAHRSHLLVKINERTRAGVCAYARACHLV